MKTKPQLSVNKSIMNPSASIQDACVAVGKLLDEFLDVSRRAGVVTVLCAIAVLLIMTAWNSTILWREHSGISAFAIRTDGITPLEKESTHVAVISPWGTETLLEYEVGSDSYVIPNEGKRLVASVLVRTPTTTLERVVFEYSFSGKLGHTWKEAPGYMVTREFADSVEITLGIPSLGNSVLPNYRDAINWRGDAVFIARAVLPGLAAAIFISLLILGGAFLRRNRWRLTKIITEKPNLTYSAAGVGLLSVLCFHLDLGYRYDFIKHLEIAQTAAVTGVYPPHCAFHVWINMLTGFSGNLIALKVAAIVLLSITKIIKFVLTYAFLQAFVKPKTEGQRLAVTAASLSLSFAYSIINWYTFPAVSPGQFGGTKWDNPTVILLIPFALMSFFRLFSDDSLRSQIVSSGLLAVSVLVKPNWVLALLPMIGILWVLRTITFRRLLLYSAPTCAALAIQYLSVFSTGAGGGIAIAPFVAWRNRSPCLLGSLTLSFAFPAAVSFCSCLVRGQRRVLLIAWALLMICLTQYAFLAEKGARLYAGNFSWGIIPATCVLFLVCTGLWLKYATVGSRHTRAWVSVCTALFVAHTLSGLYYYYRVCAGFGYNG